MQKEGTPLERSAIACQIRQTRAEEQEVEAFPEHWDRDLIDYVDALGGFKYFMLYVNKLGGNKTVLDIGAGSFRGISQIANTNLCEDLNFIATSLSKPRDEVDLSRVQARITSGEVLRGIDNESINGILAVSSIAYSKSPRVVVSNIDRVLVPGGVIKSSFKPLIVDEEITEKLSDVFDYKTHHQFSEQFRNLGYDVAIKNDKNRDEPDTERVMVAIKPGGPSIRTEAIAETYYTARELAELESPFTTTHLYLNGQL